MPRRRNLSWRTKLFLLLFAFAVIPMLALAYSSLHKLEDTSRQATLEGLQALSRAKAEALDQFTLYRKRDVERMAQLMAPDLVRLREARKAAKVAPAPETENLPKLEDGGAVETVTAPDNSEPPVKAAPEPAQRRPEQKQLDAALTDIKRTLGLIIWDHIAFEELLVFDPEGRVLVSTFGDHEGKSAADIEYVRHGRRATYVQPVFHSPITEQLTMVIATPIRDESHQLIGTMAARLNLKRFFRLINDSTGLGETGETVVAKRIGDQVAFMAPTRHDSDAVLTRRIHLGSAESRALQAAVRGDSGARRHLDYRAEPTLAAWTHVPSLEWGLLVKIDVDEALAPVIAARDRMIVLAVILFIAVASVSMIAARALVQPLRKLKNATDRISRGDLAVELDIESRDEIGDLADSFERMVAAIKFFREHSRPEGEEDELDLDVSERKAEDRAAPV